MTTINELKTSSLQSDFNKAFPPFIIYLANLIILLSFSKDLARIGFNFNWLLIRMGYFPFILIVWKIAKIKCQQNIYEVPLWLAAFYITCFCTYFSFETGGLKSDYIFGLLQLYFAIALMPITPITFYMIIYLSLSIYFGANLYLFGLSNLPDKTVTSTLIPLIVFSLLVYLINSKIRNSKYKLQDELYRTIQERDSVIDVQSAKLASIETKVALGALATQVAHDIRSPLSALTILTSRDLLIPEPTRILIGNVINRIRDIANDLIEKNRDPRIISCSSDDSIQLLSAVINPIVTEKRLQLRSSSHINIDIETSEASYGAFVKINTAELKRVLSNLIDNAIESIADKGQITIQIHSNCDCIQLIIADNGKGIPMNIVNHLGECGVSYGKDNGSGLGLYHAKNVMDKSGGALKIESKVGYGTQVTLRFPRSITPSWFLPVLQVDADTTIVIVDDDISIHQLWQERLSLFDRTEIKIINFTSPEKFEHWMCHCHEKPIQILFFFDLEYIGYYKTGLTLIEEYELQCDSVLITSHFDEKDVCERCELLNIKMIPKDFVFYIPLVFEKSSMLHTEHASV